MKVYGELMNRIMEGGGVPEVGMAATECCYTDRHAGTVIEVSANGKTLKWQRDRATRTDKNGMSDCQSYDYQPDAAGVVKTFTLGKHGWRGAGGAKSGNGLALGRRDEHHDFSF